jgi:CrcB protein
VSALTLVAVFVGGGLGALARYGAGRIVGERYSGMFPLGTCLINVTGCFLLGLLATVASAHAHTGLVLALLATGFLGGYTTFSTYALEGVVLFMDGARMIAFWSLSLPVVFGLLGAAAGALAGRGVNAV